MWTLIVIVLIHANQAPAVEIEHVDGFTSERACRTAGETIHVAAADGLRAHAYCVRKR